MRIARAYEDSTRGGDASHRDDLHLRCRDLLELDLPDAERVLQAATIKSEHAMAYADAFAAATALAHRAPLLTEDPELLLPCAPWAHEDLRSS